ncbi:MAG: TerB family tellurite resistance protein [Chitinophagaceae bacterium]
MTNTRMNKPMAGYHMLMILSAVDFKFHPEEDRVIRTFLTEEFPFPVNLDREMDIISQLKPEEWKAHFTACLYDFEEDTTPQERTRFLQFAMNLVKADNHIHDSENEYLMQLFNAWDFHVE